MAIFKVKHETKGQHVHCRLFSAKQPNMTYACCGDFVVRVEEFDSIKLAMAGVSFEDKGDA